MNVNAESLQTVLFLLVVTERVTEYLFKPIRNKLTERNDAMEWLTFATPYFSFALGAAMILAAQINLFPDLGTFGLIVTALSPGFGATALHDYFRKTPMDQVYMAAVLDAEGVPTEERKCCKQE